MNDKTTILNHVIGKKANNNHGEFLGNIIGMMSDASGEVLEYIILESDMFFGRGERFFAIPAKSSLVHITQDGRIIVHLKKDDLQFAPGISVDQCPEPNSNYGLLVFELYNYHKIQP